MRLSEFWEVRDQSRAVIPDFWAGPYWNDLDLDLSPSLHVTVEREVWLLLRRSLPEGKAYNLLVDGVYGCKSYTGNLPTLITLDYHPRAYRGFFRDIPIVYGERHRELFHFLAR